MALQTQMTSRQRMLSALRCETPDRVPFCDWFTKGSKRRIIEALNIKNPENDAAFAGAVGFDGLCYEDKAGTFMAPVFCQLLYDEDGGAHLQSEGLVNDWNDLHKIEMPDLSAPCYFDDAKQYVDRYGKSDLAVFFMMRTGMMNTIYSLGFSNFCRAVIDDVKLVKEVLDIYSDWNLQVLDEAEKMGFDFVLVCDDIAWNSGTIVSPRMFKDLFIPHLRKFADAVKLPWVFHSCGNVTRVFDDLIELGFNGFNPFQPPVMDINAMHDKYGGRICFWGNIDLTYTLCRGTVQEVDTEVRERIVKLAPDGGYIVGSANSIIDSCKTENILAMINAIKKYGAYPITA